MREQIRGFPSYSCEWVNVFITGVMGDAFVSHGFSISQQMTFPWILLHMGLHNVDDEKNHACDTIKSTRQLRLQRKYKWHPSIFMKKCIGLFLHQVYIPHHHRQGPFGFFKGFVFLACLNFRRKWLLLLCLWLFGNGRFYPHQTGLLYHYQVVYRTKSHMHMSWDILWKRKIGKMI